MTFPRREVFIPEGYVSPGEPIASHRARLAVEAEQRAELRRTELAEQRSSLNTPEVRIGIWERIHGLRLPLDPEHSVLFVVANATGLTLEQVREEQRARQRR
jgi:hypothetical protein